MSTKGESDSMVARLTLEEAAKHLKIGKFSLYQRAREGWGFLGWTELVEGGADAAYKTQRRERPEGAWSDVGMAIESEITLTNQERGKEWEYRVLAVNKAGEGQPSNTVMAVL